MSEKMTVIDLRGSDWPGFMDYGEVSAQDMIAQVKLSASYEIAQLQQVLDAKPEDFRIEIVRGKIVQHHIKTIQEGSARLR